MGWLLQCLRVCQPECGSGTSRVVPLALGSCPYPPGSLQVPTVPEMHGLWYKNSAEISQQEIPCALNTSSRSGWQLVGLPRNKLLRGESANFIIHFPNSSSMSNFSRLSNFSVQFSSSIRFHRRQEIGGDVLPTTVPGQLCYSSQHRLFNKFNLYTKTSSFILLLESE